MSLIRVETRPGESDPSFDVRANVGVFVDTASDIDVLIVLVVTLVRSL